MLALKKRAEKLVKESGHHIIDEMAAVGLQVRDVDQALVNDLRARMLQENLLQEEDDPDASAAENEDSRYVVFGHVNSSFHSAPLVVTRIERKFFHPKTTT